MEMPDDVIKQVWAINNPGFEKDLLENIMLSSRQKFFFAM